MKIFNSSGSKDRLFEMMERVNKVKLNEEYNPTAALEMAFNELENNRLNVKHTNTQVSGNETYVELMATDKQGNNIVFTFKLNSVEGDQEGVFKVDSAIMTSFAFDSADGDETVELDENGLKQFNAQHGGDLLGLVSDYADFETEEPEIDEEYQRAVEKIDSYPFGGTPRDKFQTSKAYADEKPTNPAVRVKAPELEKFVNETKVLNIDTDASVKYFQSLPEHTKEMAIRTAKLFVDNALKQQGLEYFDIPEEQYKAEIKRLALASYERYLMQMNEEQEKGEYPDPIGKKFKPKNQMPKKKKKPQSVVKLSEELEDEDYLEDIPDLEIPVDKGAKRQAMSDISGDLEGDKVEQDAEFQFNEQDDELLQQKERSEGEKLVRQHINSFERRMDFNKMSTAYEQLLKMRGELRNTPEFQKVLSSLREAIAKYFNLNNIRVTGEDIQNFFVNQVSRLGEEDESAEEETETQDDGMSYEPKGDELEQLAQDKEATGEILVGGKGDDKSPLEFTPEQVLIGLEVEAEHTDDPLIAIEIVLDHLSEDPEYYTRKANPEASAQDGAAKDAEEKSDVEKENPDIYPDGWKEMDGMFMGPNSIANKMKNGDKEMTDVLLGYQPKNVGDELNGEEDIVGEMAGMGKKTKAFKIGEYAVGGIIKVDLLGSLIKIQALDWNTKQPVEEEEFAANDMNGMDNYLNELTSSYYAGKILEWIQANI